MQFLSRIILGHNIEKCNPFEQRLKSLKGRKRPLDTPERKIERNTVMMERLPSILLKENKREREIKLKSIHTFL